MNSKSYCIAYKKDVYGKVSAVIPLEQVTSAFLNCDLEHELAPIYEETALRPYSMRPLGAKFEKADIEEKSFKTILMDTIEIS